MFVCFFFSSRRRHTRSKRDWSSDVCSSDLVWCCYKCDYYSSSLSPSFLTKRGCLYGNPLALMANGFLQQSRPLIEDQYSLLNVAATHYRLDKVVFKSNL